MEKGKFFGRNRYLLTGLGIPAGVRFIPLDGKTAESSDLDPLSFGQFFLDRIKKSVTDSFGILGTEIFLVFDRIYQIGTVHENSPSI